MTNSNDGLPMGPADLAGLNDLEHDPETVPTGRGSGSAQKKPSEPPRYMGLRFSVKQRNMIKIAAHYRDEPLHQYIWERIKDHVVQDVAEFRGQIDEMLLDSPREH